MNSSDETSGVETLGVEAAVPYRVKEIYRSIQGEGAHTGRPAVFLRFSGCNLWSGREADRARAVCRFCDTRFVGVDGVGGGTFETPDELAAAVVACWPTGTGAPPYVVCTGGEPLLQLDEAAVGALHRAGCVVAVETNGTLPAPPDIDWLCVSPKADANLVLTAGDELKLVYPQDGGEPERYANLAFRHFFLQPMDGPDLTENTRRAVEYCLSHPHWRLSVQTQKLLGLP